MFIKRSFFYVRMQKSPFFVWAMVPLPASITVYSGQKTQIKKLKFPHVNKKKLEMKIRIASETLPLYLHIATLCIGKSKEQIPQGFWMFFVRSAVGYIRLHTDMYICICTAKVFIRGEFCKTVFTNIHTENLWSDENSHMFRCHHDDSFSSTCGLEF
jgi:hypothetical protein